MKRFFKQMMFVLLVLAMLPHAIVSSSRQLAVANEKGAEEADQTQVDVGSKSTTLPAKETTIKNSPRATQLKRLDLQDVPVPENVRGFEMLVGSHERGRRLLTERLSCLDCHSIVPGEELGFPNLSGVGRRLTPKQIVTSILEPSREFAEGYKFVTLETVDGRMIRGVELGSSDTALVLRIGGETQTIPRESIEGNVRVAVSDMPQGLEDGLSPQEFADLVTFLSGLARRESLVKK